MGGRPVVMGGGPGLGMMNHMGMGMHPGMMGAGGGMYLSMNVMGGGGGGGGGGLMVPPPPPPPPPPPHGRHGPGGHPGYPGMMHPGMQQPWQGGGGGSQ